MEKEEFLAAIPQDNTDWAAQQIITSFTPAQLIELSGSLARLDNALFKSWSKDMTLNELVEAVKISLRILNASSQFVLKQ